MREFGEFIVREINGILRFISRVAIRQVVLPLLLIFSIGALVSYFQKEGVTIPEVLPPEPITVHVAGDVNMGRLTGQKIYRGETDYPFAKMNGYLADADIAFVNLESQLVDLGGVTEDPNSEYRFAGPPEGAQSLKNAGIDIVSVANNHMWDYGHNALIETWQSLEKFGVDYVGAEPDSSERCNGRTFEVKDKTITFFAITTLLNGYERTTAIDYVCYTRDAEELVRKISENKDKADWVFVSVHGGVEYQQKPSQQIVDLSHRLIDAGADAIIGHHPHVIQPIERYQDKPIFYSLGNFAFWQPFSFWTQHSYIAKLTLAEPHEVEYEVVPVKAGWQPEIATELSVIDRINTFLSTETN